MIDLEKEMENKANNNSEKNGSSEIKEDNIMNLEDIKILFEKLKLFPTLDSISLILPYTNNQSMEFAFNVVYRKKCKECIDEFEGMNEYDNICLVSNFDISELKKNIDLFSRKELNFIQSIINNAINCIDEKNIVAKIIPILNEYKEIGTSKFIEENKIKNFFNKFDINELYTLNIILDNNFEPSSKKYKSIFYEILKEKNKNLKLSIKIIVYLI